jgi:hypothetical protein
MCLNYKDGNCIVTNKKCKFGEDGEDLSMGDCDLHGDYDVWVTDKKIIVAKTEKGSKGEGKVLGYGLNFLVADELAYKKSKKLELPVDYIE